MTGFSYRRLLRVGERHEDSIDEASIIAQELIERHPDVPTFHRVMVDSLPYMVVSLGKGGRVKREGSSNESEEITHYDLWIMTKSEIERELERECLFETPPLYTGYVWISVCNILFWLPNLPRHLISVQKYFLPKFSSPFSPRKRKFRVNEFACIPVS